MTRDWDRLAWDDTVRETRNVLGWTVRQYWRAVHVALPQAALAHMIGVSPYTVSRWESGRSAGQPWHAAALRALRAGGAAMDGAERSRLAARCTSAEAGISAFAVFVARGEAARAEDLPPGN